MKVAILIAPRDFKDETVSHLQLLFGKNDIESQVVSLTTKPCTGYHGAVIKPQADARAMEAGTFDVLLIADGPGVESLKLYDHRPLLDLVKAFRETKKKIAGIGNGVRVVARANIIKDTRIAKTDEETEKLVKLYRGKPTEDFVVSDNGIITASSIDNVADFVSALTKQEAA
jgi:putative intracellular protease/amidase